MDTKRLFETGQDGPFVENTDVSESVKDYSLWSYTYSISHFADISDPIGLALILALPSIKSKPNTANHKGYYPVFFL